MTPAALAVFALLTPAPNPRILTADVHRSDPTGIAFTADGRGIVTADRGGVVARWDLASGKPVRVLNLGPVPALSYPACVPGPGGRYVAVGASDGKPQVYDAETGKLLATLPRPLVDADTWQPVFSADGNRVAFSYARGHGSPREVPAAVVVWDAAKNRAAGTVEIPVPPGGIVGAVVSLSGDGSRLAAVVFPSPTNRGDGSVELGVWDVESGKRLATRVLSDTSEAPYTGTLTFLPDGRSLLFGHGTGLAVWTTGENRWRPVAVRGERLGEPVLSPDGRTFAVAAGSRTLSFNRGWKVRTAVFETATLHERADLYPSAPFGSFDGSAETLGPGGRAFAVARRDTIRLFDAADPARNPAWANDPAKCWAALAGAPKDAGLAIRALVNQPSLALALLRDKLTPAGDTGPDAESVAGLIAALDAPAFADREAAGKKLRDHLRHAEPALRTAHAAATSAEQRTRLAALLAAADKLTPDELRHTRAVEVLEAIGTPAAAELAAKLATGAANAVLTREAKATRDRLRR